MSRWQRFENCLDHRFSVVRFFLAKRVLRWHQPLQVVFSGCYTERESPRHEMARGGGACRR
jgi:hypothetical protein